MVQFCVVILKVLYSTYSRTLNTETETSERTFFAQTSPSQYYDLYCCLLRLLRLSIKIFTVCSDFSASVLRFILLFAKTSSQY